MTGGFTGGSSIQTLPGLKRGNDLITGYGKFEKDAQSGLVTGGEVVLNADKNISSIAFTQPFLGTPAPILTLWRTGTDQFKCNHRGEEGITTCTATVEYQDNGVQVIHFSLVWADLSFGIAGSRAGAFNSDQVLVSHSDFQNESIRVIQ